MHFLLGGGIHEDACAITEACDCCNADLMFLSNTEFIYDELCEGHYIRKGTYRLKGKEVILDFEPLLVSYYHNEESETAPTKLGSVLKTEQKEKSVEVYTIGKCKDSITITNNDTVEDVAFVAGILKDKEVARKKIKILKEIGAWELLAVK